MASVDNSSYALEVLGVKKSFDKVEVLHGVDFRLNKGEIHGIIGGNGAGKSTLMKIINGVYAKDAGEIFVNGTPVNFNSALDARAQGISMVFQEFSLVSTMSVTDNLFLGCEPKKRGVIDSKEMLRRAKDVLTRLQSDIDPKTPVGELSVGNKQILEIAKTLISNDSQILIFDEPTASLSRQEIDTLFGLMRKSVEQGMSIILVSHHLQEIMEICDRVTVLRDGNSVMCENVADTDIGELVSAIVGKKIEEQQYIPPSAKRSEEPLLELSGIEWKKALHNISLSLFGGEVLGLAGMMGSGRTELLNIIYGLEKPTKGKIFVNGVETTISHPANAIKKGIGLIPEDRRTCGIIAGQTVRMNVLLSIWGKISRFFIITDNRGKQIANSFVSQLNIKTTGVEQEVSNLSGGNQQKVVLAKNMASEPKVFLLDDPTVGVDVEFKNNICTEIRKIADQGNAVLLVTGELDEMAKIADRILFLKKGQIVKEITRGSGQIISEASLLYELQSM